jgi:D-inositol-3-phosphate glycosyltransferase
VRFLDPVRHHDLAHYYRAADVLVVPSRSESFGLVAAEAQASGLPVIAANVGGLAFAVADGESGYLIDGWNPQDYAEAALEVIGDRELASRFGKGAVEFSEQFSWEATTDRLLELYDGIR